MYITNNGEFIWAENDHMLIKHMMASIWTERQTKQNYMRQVAERVILQTGDIIRHDTDENFISDLTSTGLLTKMINN